MKPMQEVLPKGQTLIYTEPTEALMLYLKMALLVGVLIGSPGVMTQVWLFVAPGLYANEKKLAIPFVAMSSFFFIAGAVFSHYVVFPLTWRSSRASRRTSCRSCRALSQRSGST